MQKWADLRERRSDTQTHLRVKGTSHLLAACLPIGRNTTPQRRPQTSRPSQPSARQPNRPRRQTQRRRCGPHHNRRHLVNRPPSGRPDLQASFATLGAAADERRRPPSHSSAVCSGAGPTGAPNERGCRRCLSGATRCSCCFMASRERERDSRPDAGPQVECSRGSHARAKIINNFPSLSRISPSGSRRPPIAQRSTSVALSLRQDTFILCSAFSLPGESCQAREAAEGKAPQSSSGRPRRKEEAACNWAREAHTWKAERGKSRAERVFQTVTGCEQLS